jgi:hypothetical protein
MKAIIAVLAALGGAAAHAQTADYIMKELPARMQNIYAINDSGVIVGGADSGYRAAAIVDGLLVPLPLGPEYSVSTATGISNAGHIVGFAFIRSGGGSHALFWPSVTSAPIRITGLDGTFSPTAVNSQGVVTGVRSDLGGHSHTFRWSQAEGMRSLDPFGSTSSFPRAISETGYIAGSVNFGDARSIARWNPDGASGVVAWSGIGSKVRDDGGIIGHDATGSVLWSVSNTRTFLGSEFNVTDMSSKGRSVGFQPSTSDDFIQFAMTRAAPSAPAMRLPIPSGAVSSRADHVNSCGMVAGWVESPARRPVVWIPPSCDAQTTASVPDVRGYQVEQATPILKASNVFAGRTNYVVGACNNIGRVVGQVPGAGSQIPTASSVELTTVVSCSVAVPNLRGETVSGASAALRSAGLALGQVRYVVDTSCSFIDAVMSQSPGASSTVNWGTAVNVSIGQRPRTACP